MSTTVLKFILEAMATIGLLAGAYLLGYVSARNEYRAMIEQERADRNALVTQQEIKINDIQKRMDTTALERDALRDRLSTSVAAVDGLAGRVRDLQARLRASPVPAAPGHPGPEGAVPGGACSAGRVDAAMQRVLDAARADGIALTVLGSKSVCECPQ